MYTIVTQHHKVAGYHDAIHHRISHDLCRCYICYILTNRIQYKWCFYFQVEQGMEFLRQKLELKYDLCKTADADTNHHDSVTMITSIPTMPKEDKAEKVSEGHCSDMNSPRIGYNKLAMDVDLMVKGIQRLKDFQEHRSFPEENSIIYDKLSPRKEKSSVVEDQPRMMIPAYDETSVSAFHEFTELDADESNEEIHIQHKIPVTPKEVDIKNQTETASVPSELNSTENDYEDNDIPSRRSFPNRNVSMSLRILRSRL